MASVIRVPVTEGCAFCDYLAGRRPYTILLRTGIAAVLVTREQRGLAHVLVMPVVHRPTLIDLTRVEAMEIGALLVDVTRAIDRVQGPEGVAVWQNNGVAADQAIPHVHFHVAGTYPGRGTERGQVPEISLAETDRIAGSLKLWL